MQYSLFIIILSNDRITCCEKSCVSWTFNNLFVLKEGCVRSLIAWNHLALYIDSPFLRVGIFLLEALRLLHLWGALRWLLRRTPTPVLEVFKSSLGGEACPRDHLLILYFFITWQSRSIHT